MPTIAIVDGIRIVIFLNDHDPPHFHAFLAERRVRIEIMSGAVLGMADGSVMERKLSAWAKTHRQSLLEAWAAAREGRSPQRIG